MLSKWVETEWEWGHGFTAAILFGRKVSDWVPGLPNVKEKR